VNKHWYIAGEAYLNHFQEIKFELRQLDFTDLEWQTFCLLTKSQHALWIQYKLDSRINHLLIDEFQDTNPIQWRLLQPLIEEFSQQQSTELDVDNDRSVLLVGDTKQSIYRFRRAEPKLFSIASNIIEQQFESTRMQLNASWRSSPAIINFVNNLFTKTTLANVINDFPAHQTELHNLSGSVTLLNTPAILKDDDNNSSGFRNPLSEPRTEKQSEHHLEAENIATKIDSLISNKHPITHNGSTRNIQYQDIIILLRNRTNAAHYEKALHQHGIPFVGSERGTLLDCLEVSDIIMLLNWLITPFNNIALVSILRCPLFSITDTILIQLAQIQSKDVGSSNWFNKIEIYLAEHDNSTLRNALSLLKHWQVVSTKIPVHDLLDMIYNEADVLEQYHRAYPLHLKSRTQTNLTRLIELALEIDSGRYPSLQQFIMHIDRIKNSADESPDTPAASNDKNRVQVMTIHASKGLEAPVIFLANADAGADLKDKYTYKTLVDWPAENDTPNMMLLANSSKRRDDITKSLIDTDSIAQQRETANLFYVAITRAQQYLFISAAKPTRTNTDWASLIQKCYTLEKSDDTETIIESHLTDLNIDNNTIDEPPAKFTSIIDENLNNPINIDTYYQDIKNSISPSKISEQSKNEAVKRENQNNNISQVKNIDSDATNRGVIIHAILEMLCNHPKLSQNECENKLGYDLTKSQWNEYWQEATQVINENDFSDFYSLKNSAFNEVPISYLDKDSTVYGIIDRIVITGNTVHIIDYKTHQTVNSDNISKYAEYYRPQLVHYQKAAQKIWPEHTIQSYLLFTHSKLLYEFESK